MRAKLERCICIQSHLGIAKQHQSVCTAARQPTQNGLYPLWRWDKVTVWEQSTNFPRKIFLFLDHFCLKRAVLLHTCFQALICFFFAQNVFIDEIGLAKIELQRSSESFSEFLHFGDKEHTMYVQTPTFVFQLRRQRLKGFFWTDALKGGCVFHYCTYSCYYNP